MSLNRDSIILSESDLVKALREGSTKAFTIIFKRYFTVIKRFVNAIVKDEESAEDIAQDVFIRLWTYRSKLVPGKSLKNLLYVIARNAAFDLLKAKRMTLISLKDAIAEAVDSKDSDDYAHLNESLNRSISVMPRRRQQVFRMSRFERKSEKEISEILNLSVRTVEKHVELALKQLRNSLE